MVPESFERSDWKSLVSRGSGTSPIQVHNLSNVPTVEAAGTDFTDDLCGAFALGVVNDMGVTSHGFRGHGAWIERGSVGCSYFRQLFLIFDCLGDDQQERAACPQLRK